MKKESKPEVLNEKTEGVTSNVLWRSPINSDFEKFLLLYKEDKIKARIAFFHSREDFGGNYNTTRGYSFQQLVVFEKESGDFSIVLFNNRWGLSITNKMYKSQSIDATVSFKKVGSKFWLIARKKGSKVLLPLTLSNLRMAFGQRVNDVEEELQKRFGWLRYVRENNFTHSIAFNTIVRKKLFSLETAMRHKYKVPYPVAKKLHLASQGRALSTLGHKTFDAFLRYIQNIENLSDEQVKSTVFWDTVRMAMVLDRKVNCSWGDARLKKEHDEWAEEITETLLDVKNRSLNLGELYVKFAEFSNYELLRTTREMVKEGMVNKHCVASYISKVDQGLCAIFRIEGHTLEVVREKGDPYSLRMNQFNGLRNEPAPQELKEKVLAVIEQFNVKLKEEHEEEQKMLLEKGVFARPKMYNSPYQIGHVDQQIMLANDDDLPF